MRQYLKTTTNCDFINITVKDCSNKQANLDNYVIIPQGFNFYDFKKSLENALKANWNNTPFNRHVNYYWVTLNHKSHFQTIHVRSEKIEEESHIDIMPYNFFKTEQEAEKLLEGIKKIFSKYNIPLKN